MSLSPALRALGIAGVAALTALPALPALAAPPPQARPVQLACPAERVQGISFPDAVGSVHADAITCLSWYGIARGGADGSFGTGEAVNRGQLATFLLRVLHEAGVPVPAGEDAFVDDDASAHEPSLDALAALGVVQGAGDGTVDPEAPVSREQMATFLVRLLELIEDEELAQAVEDFFTDDEGSVHEGAINALRGLGIAAGRAGGIFDPTSEVLREQMATFLMRLVDRLVEEGDVDVPATLVLSAEEVAPGEEVHGTVLGEGITSVSLSGCGFDDVVAAAPAEGTEGWTFTLVVPDAWPAEEEPVEEEAADEEGDVAAASADGGPEVERGDDSCELTVLVELADGSTQELEGELELLEAQEPEDLDEEESDEADEPEDDDEADDLDEEPAAEPAADPAV